MITSFQDLAAFSALMAGFFPVQIDEASTTKYYGFMNKYSEWYIMRENVTTGEYRYVKGDTNFDTNWTNRASLTYGYPTIWNV